MRSVTGAALLLTVVACLASGCFMSGLAEPSECSEKALAEPCIGEHEFLICKQSEGRLHDSRDFCRGDTPFCEPTDSGGHECVSH